MRVRCPSDQSTSETACSRANRCRPAHRRCAYRRPARAPFYLGVHEVTQSQYHAATGTHPSVYRATGQQSTKVEGLDTATFPVDSIGWGSAVAFCGKLSQQENILPAPHNPFGLYDMHGNIEEWCSDWWSETYLSEFENGVAVDPAGATSGTNARHPRRRLRHERVPLPLGKASWRRPQLCGSPFRSACGRFGRCGQSSHRPRCSSEVRSHSSMRLTRRRPRTSRR